MLMPTALSSMMFVKKKRMMEVFPLRWRNLWTEWQLRGLILVSLTNQIILIILGNRRKYTAGTWIRLIVWSAYLLADSIATMAIGTILNGLGDVYNHDGILDAKYELTTFWAPILLLHLGGTDTITAYSLEDNELWTRHLLGVVVQAIAILYIWLTAGTTSHVSLLFILMFFVGLVKYCERVWVLYKASDNKFRDSIPDIQIKSSKIMDECLLKEEQGYHVTTHQVLELDLPEHLSNESFEQYNIPDADVLLTANSLLEMVKRLFADLILGFQDRDASKEIFEKLSSPMAFRIIEIELGFIYDMFYTKAKSIYSPLGIAVRIIGIFVTLIVLLLFLTLREKHRYSKIDVNITLVLLGVALLLDLCAFRELLLSDQTARWLIKHKKTTCLKVISALRLNCNKKRRWSNSVCQFSLLRFSLRNKPLPYYGILKRFRIEKMLEIQPYDIPKSHVDDIKYLIFMEIKKVNSYGRDLKTLFGPRGGRTLEDLPDLAWSVSLGFDQSILIWHLATEICYFKDFIRPDAIAAPANKKSGEREPQDEISTEGLMHQRCNYLSRYMLYLLVRRPNMLPIGMGNIKFHSIYAGIGDFIEKQRDSVKDVTLEHASNTLSKVASEFMIAVDERDISNFVMFHACKLASDLDKCHEKWEIIKNVWLEMLCHAAGQCKGRLHAQQLRRGGELLTHAWLLMAHYGLTDHFQIPSSPAIAEAILR